MCVQVVEDDSTHAVPANGASLLGELSVSGACLGPGNLNKVSLARSEAVTVGASTRLAGSAGN